MDHRSLIVGAAKLIDLFGYWPSFHDAEVLSIRLDRSASEYGNGPSLDARIYAFEMTAEVDSAGYYVLRNHVFVQLRFHEVDCLSLHHFNHQNALMGLTIIDVSDRQLDRIKFDVSFDAAYGTDARFSCYKVEVVEVTRCDTENVPKIGAGPQRGGPTAL